MGEIEICSCPIVQCKRHSWAQILEQERAKN